MFKVSNHQVGQEVRFNVLNFTRSMKKFYNDKMNVVTKAESILNTGQKSEWRYNTCTNILFEESEL